MTMNNECTKSKVQSLLAERWNFLEFKGDVQQVELRFWFQTASVLEEVNKLKDKSFLIIHGTADGGFSTNVPLIAEF